jgi:hypothetical protein
VGRNHGYYFWNCGCDLVCDSDDVPLFPVLI